MIANLWTRLCFVLRYRTLKKIIPSVKDASQILVCHQGQIVQLKRRCPHQGALLENGYLKGSDLICPWHGCRFKLFNKS